MTATTFAPAPQVLHARPRYEACLRASERVRWTIEEVLPEGARFDFDRHLLPAGLMRTDTLAFLTAEDRRLASQVRGHAYLAIFGLVEEFILPFVLDHVRPELDLEDARTRALLGFADEEAKHIELFKRFRRCFAEQFPTSCEVIGPPRAVADAVLAHDPLGVALVILHIEWMTQAHWVESARDDSGMDSLFHSLLRHHWLEEAQHAKLDTLMVEALAAGRDREGIQRGLDAYLSIGGMLDGALAQQAEFDVRALERSRGRAFTDGQRSELVAHTHQANRWTYLGSGMVHPEFRATVASIAPDFVPRLAEVARVFA